MIDPNASTARRVTISKSLLLVVALAAAYVASLKPADILFLVSAAFSLAAAAFFPALVLGVFWKRANKWGASLGMISGLGITFYYMATTQPWLRGLFGVTSPDRRLHLVGHPADLGRPVRRAAGLRGDHHRQPADAGAEEGDAGTGRARALPGPEASARPDAVRCRQTGAASMRGGPFVCAGQPA